MPTSSSGVAYELPPRPDEGRFDLAVEAHAGNLRYAIHDLIGGWCYGVTCFDIALGGAEQGAQNVRLRFGKLLDIRT